MSDVIDRLEALKDVLRAELNCGEESYLLDLGEMYLVADGVRELLDERRDRRIPDVRSWH